MLTFEEARKIAVEHYGEPFARKGWQDEGFCLVTPQSVFDNERRGLVLIGGAWIVVDRTTGKIDEWPYIDNLDRVRRMAQVTNSR
jgi:hypothetical protein